MRSMRRPSRAAIRSGAPCGNRFVTERRMPSAKAVFFRKNPFRPSSRVLRGSRSWENSAFVPIDGARRGADVEEVLIARSPPQEAALPCASEELLKGEDEQWRRT